MAQPYVGEIRMFAGNFAPAGWSFCDGQLLPISENEALFQLIGTTYGGDGQSDFALPDMRGRIPVHAGTRTGDGVTIQTAETGGSEAVTLTVNQIPAHAHGLRGTSDGASPAYTAANGALAKIAGTNIYALSPGGLGAMKANRVQITGGSQPHDNMAPYLCINHIISLFGIFPSQT
jgi:microcystin-dependent protein